MRRCGPGGHPDQRELLADRERGIGLGFVDADAQLLDGDEVTVVQRGRELAAHVVRPPLWPIREETE